MMSASVAACCAAHPRSRGENGPQTAENVARYGSSPLTRGKPYGRAAARPRIRLIPAHAGKTLTPTEWVTKLKAHPRSRGENMVAVPRHLRVWGSSPLTRGKLQVKSCLPLHQRLIPAHAGKTRGG